MKYAEMRRIPKDVYKVIKPPGEGPLLVDGSIECRFSPFCKKVIDGNCTLADSTGKDFCLIFAEWVKQLSKPVKSKKD